MPEVIRVRGVRFFFFSHEGNELGIFMWSKRSAMQNIGSNRYNLQNRADSGVPSYVKFTNSLRITSNRLSWLTLANKPLADAVDVAFGEDELQVTLADGRRVFAPLEWFPRLRNATPAQRRNWRLIGKGVGIHWEEIDEDVSVRSLLAG